jgi:transcriptional regulator with PAS, ATPase and Fis domain
MSNTALVTTDRDFFEQARGLCQKLGLQNEINFYFARLSEASALAMSLQHEDVDVIIARGGLAMLIQETGIKVPVVEVITTGQDLARMCLEAKKITGLECPRAAFVAFDNMVTDVEIIARIANIDVKIHRLQTPEDIPRVINLVASFGYDVIFGGIRTCTIARKMGLRAVLLKSGDLSIKNALLEAKKVAFGRQIEKENAEKFKFLIDFSLEGIISVDREKRVQIINPVASKLLHCSAEDYLGAKFDTLLDLPGMDACLREGRLIRGEVLQRNNTWISLNVGPIIVEQEIIGAFVTFQEISRIQEAEATIRDEILVKKFAAKYQMADIIGRSPQILEAKRIASEMAKTDATTLILGESGTGKELFAQGIHNLSQRKSGPFVAINCAALPANLLESELFGYVEGAFTGATKKGKPGLLEMAHRGTLFLDEISEMDKYGQSRLLRVLQERQIMRLGADKYIPVDIRVVAASNRNLKNLIEEGQFREDLYYRLKVLVLNLPQLNRRLGDVDYLAREFLKHYAIHYKKAVELTPEAYGVLESYSWPGNVRELSHFIERLVVTAEGSLLDAEVIAKFIENREYDQSSQICNISVSPTQATEDFLILSALKLHGYNLQRTALELGMSRPTLYRKLKLYNIQIRKSL